MMLTSRSLCYIAISRIRRNVLSRYGVLNINKMNAVIALESNKHFVSHSAATNTSATETATTKIADHNNFSNVQYNKNVLHTNEQNKEYCESSVDKERLETINFSNGSTTQKIASAPKATSNEQTRDLHVIESDNKANLTFTQEQLFHEQEQWQEPTKHNVWYPFPRKRGSYRISEHGTSSECFEPDPMVNVLYSGRSDPEWMWMKILCGICIGATIGSAVYAFFLPEHVKIFKDEPWSPFRN